MRQVRRMMGRLLAVLASLYLALCLVLYVGQERFIFVRAPLVKGTPADVGLDYRRLELPSSGGARLVGWSVAPGESTRAANARTPGPWVLFCHGKGVNISDRKPILAMFTRMHLGVVIFDYRGHGDSTGAIRRESDLFDDGEVFYRELAARTDEIYIYGESVGTGVAAYLAQHHPCRGLVLQSPFTSLRERVEDTFPFVPVGWILRYPLEVRERVRNLGVPKLVMHSPTDEVIDFRHGERVYAACSPPKQWAELRGDHSNPDLGLVQSALEKFLRSWPGGR